MRKAAPIVWLHPNLLLENGGMKYVFETARRIAERRPIEVCVEAASPVWRKVYADAGIPLRTIGTRTWTSWVWWVGLPYYLRRDRDALEDALPESSGVVSSMFPMHWLGRRFAAARGVRHVHLCYEPFPMFHSRDLTADQSRGRRVRSRLYAEAYTRLDVEGLRSADAVLTLNPSTVEAIRQVYGVDARPAYAGVDAGVFRPYHRSECADLYKRFGLGPFAVHSTDFSLIKRTDLALRAFAAAECTGKLLVTSTNVDPQRVEAFRRDVHELGLDGRVEFLGCVPFRDVPRLYSIGNVLIQSGVSPMAGATSMSLPVKEALACGTPAVRAAMAGEDVEDGVSGFLVDPLDVRAAGGRIAQLMNDGELSRRMGDVGRRRVVERYSWDRVADVFLEALA